MNQSKSSTPTMQCGARFFSKAKKSCCYALLLYIFCLYFRFYRTISKAVLVWMIEGKGRSSFFFFLKGEKWRRYALLVNISYLYFSLYRTFETDHKFSFDIVIFYLIYNYESKRTERKHFPQTWGQSKACWESGISPRKMDGGGAEQIKAMECKTPKVGKEKILVGLPTKNNRWEFSFSRQQTKWCKCSFFLTF